MRLGVTIVVVALIFAILYWASPNVKHPGFRWISAGAFVAVATWPVIIFLIWLWVSNLAILIGAEFDAEREREHQMERGQPRDEEPFLEPRDTTKMDS